MQWGEQVCLTLLFWDGDRQVEYTAFSLGTSRWGLCSTIPQVLQRFYAPPANTRLTVRFLDGRTPVEFETCVLGYRQTSPMTMVLAEPTSVQRRERRGANRELVQQPVSYLIDGANATGDETRTVDLSCGGLAMVTATMLTRGALLTLLLRLPEEVLCLGGRVAWSGYRSRTRMAGVEFCRVPDAAEQTIARYLFELERQRRNRYGGSSLAT